MLQFSKGWQDFVKQASRSMKIFNDQGALLVLVLMRPELCIQGDVLNTGLLQYINPLSEQEKKTSKVRLPCLFGASQHAWRAALGADLERAPVDKLHLSQPSLCTVNLTHTIICAQHGVWILCE